MAHCPVCNMDVDEDKMEDHGKMHKAGETEEEHKGHSH